MVTWQTDSKQFTPVGRECVLAGVGDGRALRGLGDQKIIIPPGLQFNLALE